MRVLLIVNSSASSVTARARVVVQKAIAAEHDLTVAPTSRRGHATHLAQGAAADGVDVVAVLGGDGTLNEATNGLAGLARPTATALAALPGGSTNVFARTIGMANDPVEATGQMLASLRAGRIESVSLGNLNGRFFLFHAGLGYDAAVVAAVERHSTAKRYLGAAVFLGVAADVWARRFDRRTPWFAVETTDRDGRHSGTDGGFLAIALNTSPYTFLGERPLDVAPGTGFTTALSLLTVRSLGLPTLLRIIGAAWRGGPGGSDPFARHRAALLQRQLDRIEIRSERPLPYQLDGDYLGAIDRFVITSAPDALRLVLPPPPAPTDT